VVCAVRPGRVRELEVISGTLTAVPDRLNDLGGKAGGYARRSSGSTPAAPATRAMAPKRVRWTQSGGRVT
jgi:hypothetical protein